MSNIKLLLINTIGLTGADLLLPKLSLFKEIAMLPGQNFGIYKDNLYRVHEYKGWDSSDVFDSLSRNLYTKGGRIWMGLTKNMDEVERNAYPKVLHKNIFIKKIKSSRDYIDVLKVYILSYYEACNFDSSKIVFASWFANNVLLNHSHYNNFSEEVKVIHVSCSISRWLTYISQTRTWDCSKAIKFWLVNNLYALMYARDKGNTLIIQIDDLINSENDLINKIEDFLSLKSKKDLNKEPLVGFLKINHAIISEQNTIANQLNEIYKDFSLFKLALKFDDWSNEFLNQKMSKEIFEKFSNFWNSTCHTNFDWIGPIGDEIIEEIFKFNQIKSDKNFSYTFYHEYFELNSDHYDKVNHKLNHYLGCLENEIILPPLPYFIRICIEYLTSAAKNSIKLGHSYINFKEGKVFLTLKSDAFQKKINSFGMRDNFDNLEHLINEAELASKQ